MEYKMSMRMVGMPCFECGNETLVMLDDPKKLKEANIICQQQHKLKVEQWEREGSIGRRPKGAMKDDSCPRYGCFAFRIHNSVGNCNECLAAGAKADPRFVIILYSFKIDMYTHLFFIIQLNTKLYSSCEVCVLNCRVACSANHYDKIHLQKEINSTDQKIVNTNVKSIMIDGKPVAMNKDMLKAQHRALKQKKFGKQSEIFWIR